MRTSTELCDMKVISRRTDLQMALGNERHDRLAVHGYSPEIDQYAGTGRRRHSRRRIPVGFLSARWCALPAGLHRNHLLGAEHPRRDLGHEWLSNRAYALDAFTSSARPIYVAPCAREHRMFASGQERSFPPFSPISVRANSRHSMPPNEQSEISLNAAGSTKGLRGRPWGLDASPPQ